MLVVLAIGNLGGYRPFVSSKLSHNLRVDLNATNGS